MVHRPKTFPGARLIVAGVAAAIALYGGYMAFNSTPASPAGLKVVQLTIHKSHIFAEVADTPAAIEQGLGGRTSMPADRAMLFQFDSDGMYCFWMKEMHFPIDVVWLDNSKKVVHIKHRAQPSSYPDQICPDTDSRYVIEMNAGQAEKLGIQLGNEVIIPNIP
jgi:uncharacterized membrane protein (UPF0127 family)